MITTEQILNAKILIIDDEPANIMVLVETLKQGGHTFIKSITDPREALETYKNFQPDLVLLDLNMPHLSGFQVMDQIKEADPESQTPIMILTALIDQGTRLQALNAGVRDFLTKPFDILEVSSRIRNMLEISLLYRQILDSKNALEELHEMTILDLTATKLKLQNEIDRREKLEKQLEGSSRNMEKVDD